MVGVDFSSIMTRLSQSDAGTVSVETPLRTQTVVGIEVIGVCHKEAQKAQTVATSLSFIADQNKTCPVEGMTVSTLKQFQRRGPERFGFRSALAAYDVLMKRNH